PRIHADLLSLLVSIGPVISASPLEEVANPTYCLCPSYGLFAYITDSEILIFIPIDATVCIAQIFHCPSCTVALLIFSGDHHVGLTSYIRVATKIMCLGQSTWRIFDQNDN